MNQLLTPSPCPVPCTGVCGHIGNNGVDHVTLELSRHKPDIVNMLHYRVNSQQENISNIQGQHNKSGE